MRRSLFATALMSTLCREVAGKNRRIPRRALEGLRLAWLKVGDPAFAYDLHGSTILLPLSHELPLLRALFPDYSENLGLLVRALAASGRSVTMVDIGANVADSVAMVGSGQRVQYLCVEGDGKYLPYLEHNARLLNGVAIERSYVASADVDLEHNKVLRVGGTARLATAAEASTDVGIGTVRTLAEILEGHPDFAKPTVIKIDTDGHDVGIIRSAADTLRTHHPVLFFEFDPYHTTSVGGTDPLRIFADLADMGYSEVAVYRNRGDFVGQFGLPSTELVKMARDLGPGQENFYWDIIAVHAADSDVLPAIR